MNVGTAPFGGPTQITATPSGPVTAQRPIKFPARRAAEVLRDLGAGEERQPAMARPDFDRRETVGTGLRAGVSSFIFFGSGAFIPVLPYLSPCCRRGPTSSPI